MVINTTTKSKRQWKCAFHGHRLFQQTSRYQNVSLMRCSVVASRTATCQTRALEKWVITLQRLQVLRKRVSRGVRKILRSAS